jgi:hypothetical protein
VLFISRFLSLSTIVLPPVASQLFGNSADFIILHLTFPQDPPPFFLFHLRIRASQDVPMTSARSLFAAKKRELNMWGGSWRPAVTTCWFCCSWWSSDSPACCLRPASCSLPEFCGSHLAPTATSCSCLAAAAAWIRSSVLSIARKRFSRLVVASISTCTQMTE